MRKLPVGEKYYTVEEIALHLRMSKMTIYRLVHSGELPYVQFGRTLRIKAEAFHAWEDIQIRGEEL